MDIIGTDLEYWNLQNNTYKIYKEAKKRENHRYILKASKKK